MIKVNDVKNLYNILKGAKYSKLDDSDKIKVWKITRVLKPITEQLDEDIKDATTSLVPYENFFVDYQKAQAYEKNKENSKMSDEEYKAFIVEFIKYNKLINDTIKDLSEKEIEVSFDPLDEQGFSKLMASNDWTLEQVMQLETIINN